MIVWAYAQREQPGERIAEHHEPPEPHRWSQTTLRARDHALSYSRFVGDSLLTFGCVAPSSAQVSAQVDKARIGLYLSPASHWMYEVDRWPQVDVIRPSHGPGFVAPQCQLGPANDDSSVSFPIFPDVVTHRD